MDFPGDLSLSGYDDLPNDTIVTPNITSVRQPLEEMGKLAANILFRMVESDFVPNSEYILKTKLVIRDSVRKL